MFTFETTVRSGRPSQRINTAFYRFLELKGSAGNDVPRMLTAPDGGFDHIVVTLWSADALEEFKAYLESFELAPPHGSAPFTGHDGALGAA